jgi:uncharacterized protein YaaW (UPF0174 family)
MLSKGNAMATLRDDPELVPLLEGAEYSDLGVLVDYITDSGKGRISLDKSVMCGLVAANARQAFTSDERRVIAREIQLFGGNTFANLARGGQGVTYAEIACDVAAKMSAEHANGANVLSVESAILQRLMERAWEKMSAQERADLVASNGIGTQGVGPAALAALLALIRAGGPSAFRFAAAAASAMTRQTLGRGLALGAAAAPLGPAITVLTGPIGWVLTALWTGYDLASPGYRVTVPCVVQLAYMRRKSLVNA